MIRGVTGCAGRTAPSQNGASGNRSRQAAANIHEVFALDKEFNLAISDIESRTIHFAPSIRKISRV